MSFLNPVAFAFAGLIPVLVLLYFLKLKRNEQTISSTFIWQKSIEDLTVNSPFQRLRKNLLLFLQLLILAALIFCLVRPMMALKGSQGQNAILLVDHSASMGAGDADGKSRLERAKEEAHRLIDNMGKGDSMRVISFASKSAVLTSVVSNKTTLREAIDSIEVEETSTNIREAMQLAITVGRTKENAEIVILSDGGFEGVSDMEIVSAPIHFVSIGSGADNVGIVGLHVFKDPSREGWREIFVSVENFSDKEVHTSLEVRIDDRLVDVLAIDLNSKQRKDHITSLPGIEAGVVKVTLDMEDDLPYDDTVWAVIEERRPRRFLLVSSGNYFLERALRSAGKLNIIDIQAFDTSPPQPGEYDVVVFDRIGTTKGFIDNSIYFDSYPTTWGVEELETVANPFVLDWDRTHPTTRFVSFDNLRIAEGTNVRVPKEARVLLESAEGPLVATLGLQRKRSVVVAFDMFQSNWPLRVSFPIFVANCLDWVTGTSEERVGASGITGEPIVVQVPKGTGSVTVVTPAGEEYLLPKEAATERVFARTEKVGMYKAMWGDESEQLYAVNLRDRNESNIAPRGSFEMEGVKIKGTKKAALSNREVWKWFALMALAVLLVEWYIYNRKVYV